MRAPALTLGLLAAVTLAAAPLSPASARGWHRGHGGGLLFGVVAAAGAVVGAAATIATAPVRILADAAAPGYGTPVPAPVYAAPQAPAYYAPPRPAAYYAPPAQAYYPPPPQAYYPPPGYAYPPR